MNRKENGVKKYDLINGAAAREEAQRLLMPDELVTMNLFELDVYKRQLPIVEILE